MPRGEPSEEAILEAMREYRDRPVVTVEDIRKVSRYRDADKIRTVLEQMERKVLVQSRLVTDGDGDEVRVWWESGSMRYVE